MAKGGYNGGSTVLRVFGPSASDARKAAERRAKSFGGGLIQNSVKEFDGTLDEPVLIKKDEIYRTPRRGRRMKP